MVTTDPAARSATGLAQADHGVDQRSPHRGLTIAAGVLVGVIIALVWSVKLVDSDIGHNLANGLLGREAEQVDLSSTVTSLVFAFVTGVAGTFTACNVAVFSAIAPSVRDGSSRLASARRALRPLGWLALGAVAVTSLYGVLASLLGSRLPQLSTRVVGDGVPVRLWQSVVVFSVIGLVLLYLGLTALRLVPDPLAGLTARWPQTPYLVLGVLLGGFTIGRPWPMFNRLFRHAAETGNPLLVIGALALVILGNMLLMAALLLLLSMTRFPRWLQAVPSRIVTATSFALLAGGAFTLVYWGVRVPARLGYGWFPTMPWK
ncbi:MAG TPA: hypothetical protein VGX49_02915 [Jatrophihabitans sp.]|jgi:uncharacterized membrane protein|nr:hypothetical protein [Jatrophihabitans sp.]